MTGDTPPPDAELAARLAWIGRVKGMHRNKRLLGFAGILAGAGVLLWWKFRPDAPDWALWLGAGLLAASWMLFVYVILSRWRWVKQNPYTPPA